MSAVTPQRPPRVRRRFLLGALFVAVVAVLLIGTHRYAIYDWVKLHNYMPPAAIAQLATDDTMTSYARHVYYVNHPQLEDRQVFAPHCPSGTEQTVVLGCYQSNQAGIHLLKVDNSDLAGIEEVTAAHETLHALYDRLSSAKRKQVDAMLEDYYQHDLTDQTIKQTIADYQKSEPGEVVNEMHSVFGTEVADLPSGLETYYKQYFTDRSKITGYYAAYEQAFTSRQAEIKQDDAQLSAWKAQISTLQTSVSAKQGELSSQQSQLNKARASGNVQLYNSEVASYNQLVNSYNADVSNLKSLINEYNQLVAKRNSIALEEQQLVQDISSSAVTK